MSVGRDVRVIQDSTRDPEKVLAAVQAKSFVTTILDSETAGIARDVQDFTKLMAGYCSKCPCISSGTTTEAPGCPSAKASIMAFLTMSGERTAILDHNFLNSLSELLKATTSMPTTRTVIFVSDGFNRFPGRELYAVMDGFGPTGNMSQFNPRSTGNELESLVRLAVRYDVKFYTIDSRGLYTPASLPGNSFDASSSTGIVPNAVDSSAMSVARENTDALALLAHQTGGTFFENDNDLFKGIHRAFADGREYYVLAYAPTNRTVDGKFRKISVSVKKQKSMRVNAKAGYWATE
jgi:VWFA-related protein